MNLIADKISEKFGVRVFVDKETASKQAANAIAQLIKTKNSKGEKTILGLATGSTPLQLYTELIRLHKEEELSFKNVITFNLDEYYPMTPQSEHSYVHFMKENLFNHIDIEIENVNIPDGTIPKEEMENYCSSYEKKIREAGGIDLQLLGIGRTGHIGFNEPDSDWNTVTRIVTLDPLTRKDAAKGFGGIENVPTKAITMGVGSILKSKKIIMMAWGKDKATIVDEMINGIVSDQVPATYLQLHQNVAVYLDQEASIAL